MMQFSPTLRKKGSAHFANQERPTLSKSMIDCYSCFTSQNETMMSLLSNSEIKV